MVIVEENPVLASALAGIFREIGYTVRVACEGLAALRCLRERVPDVLLSDLEMPCMSGFELLPVVRRRYALIGVIAMSGAYSGVAVPLGVPADAFYAKGCGPVTRLLELLHAMKDEPKRHAVRSTVRVDSDATTRARWEPNKLRPRVEPEAE
ncbi:response regulator [Bryocella elongata]